MNILFTICGRAGSKGIKNKNVKSFLEVPLALYALSAIQLYVNENEKINYDIVVNTDSQELINIIVNSKIIPVEVIHRRANLSGPFIAKIDVIKDSLFQMEERRKLKYDYVIDLDLTSPLRQIEDIKNLVDKMQKTNCDLVLSVVKSRRNPYFNMLKQSETKEGYEMVIKTSFVARQQESSP